MTERHRNLRALLRAYEPGTEVEHRHRSAIRGHLDEPTAFDRDTYDPGHITGSGFVVHPTEQAVVLVEHRKLGRWLQPGGHVESNDPDIEASARREVGEETGLSELIGLGIVDLDVHPFPARDGQPAHLHLDVRMGFVAGSEELAHGDESTGIAWVPFDRVLEMDESLARAVRRLGAMDAAGTLRPD